MEKIIFKNIMSGVVFDNQFQRQSSFRYVRDPVVDRL